MTDIDPPPQNRLSDATPQEWDNAAKAINKQVGGNHYKEMAEQPIEFITANQLGFCEGNAIKYICRYKAKGGAEDIEKAIHYLQILKESIAEKDKLYGLGGTI
jgi:hypothetical protein|tara:strand:+ start:14 stop:322 length:309 start_codon:yes stop_codon:yes gene_type:complete